MTTAVDTLATQVRQKAQGSTDCAFWLVVAEALQQRCDEIQRLRASATASEKPLVMADGRLFADYIRNALPDDYPMDEWTRGYEACKRRLARILLPQMEKANG